MQRVRLPAAMATMHSWHWRCGTPRPWQMHGLNGRHNPISTSVTSCASRSKSGAAPTATPGLSSKVLLVDGLNIAFRTWAAMSQRPLTTSDGIPTTIAFNFMRTLGNAVVAEQPRYVCVVFDAPKGSSSRKELHAAYKANRKPVAPSFSWDLANARALLQVLRVPMLQMPGYEADDVIAALTGHAVAQQLPVRLLSSDKDLWQLVDDAADVAALVPGITGSSGKNLALVDEAGVMERLQVPPAQVADFKALSGDASDNLPGVPGIGPKTAAELLAKHGTLDGVFQHLEDNKPGVVKKLTGQEELARTFQELVQLRPAAVPQIDWSLLQLQGFSIEDADPLIDRLQMPSLRKTLAGYQAAMGGIAAPARELQDLAYAAAEDNDRKLEQLAQQAAAEQEAADAEQGEDEDEQQPTALADSAPTMDTAAEVLPSSNAGESHGVQATGEAAGGSAGDGAAATSRRSRGKKAPGQPSAAVGNGGAPSEPVAGDTAAAKTKRRSKKQSSQLDAEPPSAAATLGGTAAEDASAARPAPRETTERQPKAAGGRGSGRGAG